MRSALQFFLNQNEGNNRRKEKYNKFIDIKFSNSNSNFLPPSSFDFHQNDWKSLNDKI